MPAALSSLPEHLVMKGQVKRVSMQSKHICRPWNPCFAFTPHTGLFLSSMPNLKLDEEGPVVAVKGKSLLPYCHFELEDSDYITANRRNSDLRGPGGMSLDPQTKVIEFSSVGVHVKNSRWTSSQPRNVFWSFGSFIIFIQQSHIWLWLTWRAPWRWGGSLFSILGVELSLLAIRSWETLPDSPSYTGPPSWIVCVFVHTFPFNYERVFRDSLQ